MLKSTKEELRTAIYTHTSTTGGMNLSSFTTAANKLTDEYAKETKGRCMNLGERQSYIKELQKIKEEYLPASGEYSARSARSRADGIIYAMEYAMIKETAGEKKDLPASEFAKPQKKDNDSRDDR